jgi:iron complex outermembrane receptor protein
MLARGMAALVGALVGAASAASADSAPDDGFVDMSLEDLLTMEVTSVSKRPQRVSETPSAIFVITQEDIRRSGHANVAELLRMVPGVNVGQTTPKSWTIGIRGDQSGFSRMLLVLLDGRAVYNSSFNGTFWELTDVPLEEIDRIEIIRGPGASVWGANAVHGIINIIRKQPDADRSFLTTAIGTEDRLITSLGHSGVHERMRYRVSGHWVNRDAFRARDDSRDQHDGYRYGTTAARADIELGPGDLLTLQGDWYEGDLNSQARRDLDMTGNPGSVLRSFETTSTSGGNAIARFERRHSEDSTTELQLYIDKAYRDFIIVEDMRTTYDFEARNRFRWGPHTLNWGLGTRHVQERLGTTLNFIATPKKQDEAVYNFYVQDEIQALDGALRFTLGSKVEWNTFTGWEVQPTARALWHPAERHQVWAGFSRSVRVPTRTDRGEYDVRVGFFGGQPVNVVGTDDFDSEVILAWDLGYRFQPSSTLHVDLTGFTHRTQNFGVFVGLPPFGLTQELRDSGERRAIGAEASVRWQPADWWRLTFGWSHIHIQHSDGVYSPAGTASAPPHQLSVLSYLDLPGNLELDFGVYYHGRVGDRFSIVTDDELSGYTRHDLRLGWRPSDQLELSLVGQNLFDRLHREGVDFFEAGPLVGLQGSSVQRSIVGRINWRF